MFRVLMEGFLVYLEIAFDQCETNLVYFWYTTKSYNDNLMLEKWFKLNDLIISDENELLPIVHLDDIGVQRMKN
jgi:hypothetical protein